ncbi:MAG: valine--tRNA ligase [Candidatus Levybacteria bacterium]|nr:valine--tRNA ligase [Candidatus Levybacteria bacterium]
MDKAYDHKKVEDKIYESWEKNGYFKPEVNKEAYESDNLNDKFTIILPPPNANGALHFGHAMFTVEDILVRYNRMKGKAALWLPGTDHAGIETQFVFEKKLKLEGKSRLDYDQPTLYSMIHEYVEEHRGGIQKQLKRLGFSLDWSREKYTLDPDIVKLVYKTFHQMYNDNLIYRGYKLVNYCTFDGTSFSDLEVAHEEKTHPLYYIKYGPLVLATTRPETKFGDTAVAVHPEDKRYHQYINQEIDIETVLGPAKIKVIADEMVDPEFGTGVVKITPAHDFNDFETGKRHNLPMKQVIGFDGKMTEAAGKFAGMYAKEARRAIVEEMQVKGLIEKIDEKYATNLSLCYKCKNVLEPLPLEQWFVKVESLSKKAIEVVKTGKIKITPKNFEAIYFQWLENLRDWNISRQIAWGIRIPAWKCDDCDAWIVTEGDTPKQCSECKSLKLTQDTDTFDTWFSSGQWPYLTLKTGNPSDFEKFYPTDVMETAYDILKAWVTRMVMLGVYVTDEIPFKNVLFHGIVNDPYGKKMSKSKGNVVNPLELVDQYGADAVRFALIYGNATGNDQALSYPKLDASRKFANKLWNIGRYAEFYLQSDAFKDTEIPFFNPEKALTNDEDRLIIEELNKTITKVTDSIENYRFHDGADALYEFTWHVLADKYMEQIKERLRSGDKEALSVFRHVFLNVLKLLHPYMPFITEELWGKLPKMKNDMIIISKWPTK